MDSPIDRILETGRGVCQDYAHVMASILRGWGVPCRYVSGYLGPDDDFTTPGESHAWVECWYPGVGWIGLDPGPTTAGATTDTCAWRSEETMRMSPRTRGVYRGAADSKLTTQVMVTRHRDAAGTA